MKVSQLIMRQFRNLGTTDLAPEGRFNVFWGNNAQGKTNLLEGIDLLGSLKSFRGARNDELIGEGFNDCRLSGKVETGGASREIVVYISAEGKSARVDGKNVRRPADFFGYLRPVVFAPEEINLLKGPPAGRRALIDRAIFQSDVTFLDRAREYERCLRQRNRLLRDGALLSEISPWTEALVHAGARVRRNRSAYLTRLQPLLGDSYRQIAGNGEEAEIVYRPNSVSEADLTEELYREVEKVAERERRMGQTLAGPHRDDPDFRISGRSLRLFGSQGQQRSFLLAFKTAQVRDLETITGTSPVLLLDDMTSELDRRRQEFFFRYLRESQGQVFLTTTDIKPLLEQGLAPARYFRVEKGIVHQD